MINIENITNKFLSYIGNIHSELGQDVLALALYDFKKNGYFVEFGAMDGKQYSNSYLLEKEYNWKGIVAEPGKTFHTELYKNRFCIIDTRAVTDKSDEILEFKETQINLGLSGIVKHVLNCKDYHVARRQLSAGEIYQVKTVSLMDLLKEHKAPNVIDYLSLDTEGSELLILESIDFKKYKIGVITVEHNYVSTARDSIHDLLTKNNYLRILEKYSKYDDWYILLK